MEYHFRYSLGLVTYHLNSLSISHFKYLRSVLGRPNASHYPGFSSEPIDAFGDLHLDLEEYCADFLERTDDCLSRWIEDALANPSEGHGLPE